jgi:hypothetical protein
METGGWEWKNDDVQDEGTLSCGCNGGDSVSLFFYVHPVARVTGEIWPREFP